MVFIWAFFWCIFHVCSILIALDIPYYVLGTAHHQYCGTGGTVKYWQYHSTEYCGTGGTVEYWQYRSTEYCGTGGTVDL